VSNISVDYDILNQKGSPAWYSDTYANIPTAGYKGRMFISIDTYAFYRDTGTGWDLIGGPGTGTITGSGTAGQVSYFNGSSTLAGSNNLFWDNTNGRLGINTTTPGAPLDIHGTGTQLQLNGTGANNSYLVFQNTGASKWRIGNLSPANSFEIYNAATSTYALTIASATNEVVIQQKLTIGGQVSFGSTLTNNTYTYTLPSATGTLALTSNIPANIVTGTGASGQVAYWNGTATQTGTNNFFWDNTNTRLGINTNAPLSTLQVVPVTLSSTIVRFGEASGTTGKQLLFGIDSTTGRSEIQSVWQGTANTPLGLNVAGGNVLIGTTTDGGYKLSVNGTGNFSGALTGDSTANFTGNVQTSEYYRSNTPTTNSITIGVSANTNYGFIGNSNYWGFRTGTAGDFNIDVNNSSSPINALKISQSRVVTLLSLGTGAVTATSGVLSTTSDMNLKISDGYIDNALDKILKLTPRYFLWKEESGLPTDLRQLGFYAQEVNEALGEEVANTPKNKNDKWGIYDRGIIAMLTKAMQEQQAQIEELKTQIQTLLN